MFFYRSLVSKFLSPSLVLKRKTNHLKRLKKRHSKDIIYKGFFFGLVEIVFLGFGTFACFSFCGFVGFGD